MRELKFKAYHAPLGFSEPFGIGGHPVWIDSAGVEQHVSYWSRICKIVQSTGEIYKSGDPIWEGDIFNRGGDIYKVVWVSGAFKAQMIYYKWLEKDVSNENKYSYIDSWKTFDTELIGTIHDKGGEQKTEENVPYRLAAAIGAQGTLEALKGLGIGIKDEEEPICGLCGNSYDDCICATEKGGYRR